MRVYCDVEANCGSIPIPVPSMTIVDREADRHLHGVAVQAKAKRDCSWGLWYERSATPGPWGFQIVPIPTFWRHNIIPFKNHKKVIHVIIEVEILLPA